MTGQGGIIDFFWYTSMIFSDIPNITIIFWGGAEVVDLLVYIFKLSGLGFDSETCYDILPRVTKTEITERRLDVAHLKDNVGHHLISGCH